MVAVNTDFCLQIANRVSLENIEEGKNCIISPISIHACLCLVAAGATGNTLHQLLFHPKYQTIDDLNQQSSRIIKLLSPRGDRGPVLSIANSIWVDKRFLLNRPFQEITSNAHGAQAANLDFQSNAAQATQEINAWVESATNGLIKKMIPSISSDPRLVLVNALYFHSVWLGSYSKFYARDRKFHLLNGHTIQVPFMSKSGPRSFRALKECKVLQLPYDRRNFSMYIFLPEEKNGLKNLIENINLNVSFFSQDFMLEEVVLADFAIPKFKFSFDFEASKVIKELGLALPFMDPTGISNMVDSAEGLVISQVLHKSCVDVNEEGTTAAAATAVLCLGAPRLTPSKITFVADHPFIFMIREEASRMVLFIGTVLNPSQV